MRHVAKYALTSVADTPESADIVTTSAGKCIQAWLDKKGNWDEVDGRMVLLLQDGRKAHFDNERIANNSVGTLDRWLLTEPIDGGTFETELLLGRAGSTTAIVVKQRAGNPTTVITPFRFEAASPSVLSALLRSHHQWRCGNTTLWSGSRAFIGRQGSESLISLIRDPARDVPIVLVSEYDGFQLSPSLDEKIARDICGLALVCRVDVDAAYALSSALGAEWSCFNAAVRLYWPRINFGTSPFLHPLWTAERLLDAAGSHDAAAQRLRSAIRRRVLSLSTFTVADPEAISSAVRANQTLEDVKKTARLQEEELETARSTISRLLTDVENLRLQLDHARAGASELAEEDEAEASPATDVEPHTVEDAVRLARSRFSDLLTFGSDVKTGTLELAPDAGPPGKVLQHLKVLAELSRTMATGNGLGTKVQSWLKSRGVRASPDDESDLQTFDDGIGRRRSFSLHTKPNEHTDPSKCVRIYYYFDSERKRMVIGWVGRHP